MQFYKYNNLFSGSLSAKPIYKSIIFLQNSPKHKYALPITAKKKSSDDEENTKRNENNIVPIKNEDLTNMMVSSDVILIMRHLLYKAYETNKKKYVWILSSYRNLYHINDNNVNYKCVIGFSQKEQAESMKNMLENQYKKVFTLEKIDLVKLHQICNKFKVNLIVYHKCPRTKTMKETKYWCLEYIKNDTKYIS